jgi:hypothetical protein
MIQDGHVARMGAMKNAYKVLVRKPEGKIPLGRCRPRWECNVRLDLRKVGWEGVNRTHLAEDRDLRWRALVNTVMSLRFP